MKQLVWFKANAQGNGWKPVAWQGWLIWSLCIGLNLATVIFFIPLFFHSWLVFFLFLAVFIAINSAFLWICFKTGEPVQWKNQK